MNGQPDRRSPGRRWLDFWFAKADPTTLGFMRVVTGIIVVYVHLTYCFDLQSFFGEHGWYSLEEINAERTEFPWKVRNFWQWDDDEFFYPAYVPEQPHRRKPVMDWYRKLGAMPRDQRAAALEFVFKLQELPNPNSAVLGLQFAGRIPQIAIVEKNRLDMIVEPSLRMPGDGVPEFVDVLKPEERRTLRDQLAAFLAVLPAGPDHRNYVIEHLSEIGTLQRKKLLEVLRDLPDDAAERDARLRFLEKWNNVPDNSIRLGIPIFSIWFHVYKPEEMAAAHGVILVIMVMFTLGLFTRVTSVLTWLAAVSYIHRTQQILFGMDTMMNLLLIYLMIGPSGAALSLDRWRACRKARRLSQQRNNGGLDAPTRAYLAAPPKSACAGFALRLVQIHFCFIYMAAGLSKLKGMAWWSHNAYWDTLANPEFTMLYYSLYEDALRSFVQIRPLYAFTAAFGVIFTLFMEISLPFLVWTRLRPVIVIGGVFFHFGIGLFMGLNIFALLMMTLLLSYIPGEAFRAVLFGKNGSPAE